ncbi:FKBP-type peptidyl-prolyl cis-trans isomerase [Caulobacter sp. NIBR1757]|uniref:FKBP-type peptidyl-prolyl cis-trans isomerase n=1 Tax=Caulobacter sp. NIBR1757 TaxID=3016000 RepID=UPI0022F0C375|nr:FKBP-type peptidyl-prolyl cis-trans isomerase [Caulobacter sp. NIBR1757]WGM41196.1 Peptidyl-prolyl cis-trans isomerase Mip [Caulobacter sp. NIBR1757]
MRFIPVILAAIAALSLASCDNERLAQKNALEGEAFMKENATKPGVQVLKDGVQYIVVTSGPVSGLKPKKGDELKVHYEGKLLNGNVFDSSFERGAPAIMPFENFIPAWMEVIPKMRPGDEWIVYVPPEEGYGKDGSGNIPPNSVLVFRIQLLGVLPARGNSVLG